MESVPTVQAGLEDVVALESKICFIDGRGGRLLYQGYDIRELAERSTFEEVAYLLWYGRLPTERQLADLRTRLGALRALPPGVVDILDRIPRDCHPMDVLRTAVSALALFEPSESRPGASSIGGALRLTAVLPTVLGYYHRRRMGLPPVTVDPGVSHAGWILAALRDAPASELEVRALDVALILHADHELNASTFAARVTASTLSDLYSAITSAIGTLKGPLHGGANERVMELLAEIGTVARVEEVVREKLARHERIMGFGHRVYKVEDPRATILREWSRRIGESKGNLTSYHLLRKLEEVVHAEKGLYPNVDLYSGSVYTLLGIPNDLFTPLFASSRVAGWTAHVLEEYQDLRLIRPTAQYVGPTDLAYVAIGGRT
ncbi:MAG TPA: citrate/2-methylcitrate synthase [Thermoplasmata archaeon]|nr:citrate/2-methylcitrate synthase [Thermoplasmata archaeon]HUJ78132.1 citrate/2-methylcitrate synthase [Thermoplasmata archaeon]